ncbi:MAG: hypothetical protein J6U22_04460, partial [Bacteroidaceae bacterium]|nr:hypothetical protein [Bacteroidaceae bacterium]
MKTTVFITRRGRSFAYAKVNPTKRSSPIKSFQEMTSRKELRVSEGQSDEAFLSDQKLPGED